MKKDYPNALSCYKHAVKMAKARNSSRELFDAYLNCAEAAIKMGNRQLADIYVAKAAGLPYFILGQLGLDSFQGEQPGSGAAQTERRSARSLMANIESLSRDLFHHPGLVEPLRQRCAGYWNMLNFGLALRDAIAWTEADPNSIEAWSYRAECYYRAGDAAGLSSACKKIERLGSTAHRFAARYYELMGDYEKYEKELRMASECEEPGAKETWSSHTMNCGRFGIARLTEKDFLYYFFVKDSFPSNLSVVPDPIVRHIIAGYFKSFHAPIHELGTMIGMERDAVKVWVSGRTGRIELHEPVLPDPLLPPDFSNFFVGNEEEFKQVCRARDVISAAFMHDVVLNARSQFCMSLAAVEISQAITQWIRDENAPLPSLDRILTILVSWIRVACPADPVASCTDLDQMIPVVYLKKHHTEAARNHGFSILKRCLERTLPGDMREKLVEIKTPEDLLGLFSSNISCTVPKTNLEMFVTREMFGQVHFGVRLLPYIDGSERIMKRLLNSWTRALMELKHGKLSLGIFETLRYWLMVRPIWTKKGTSYMSVIFASFLLVLGYQIGPDAKWDKESELSALMSTTFEEFLHFLNIADIPLVKAPDYPLIAKFLPNMQARFNFIKPVSL